MTPLFSRNRLSNRVQAWPRVDAPGGHVYQSRAWAEHRSDPEEIRVIDAERVLLLSIDHFRGRDGIEIVQPSGTVFTLRAGKVIRMQAFWERRNALEAAGLQP